VANVLALVTQLGVTLLLSWWVLRRDLTRLGPKELARTWNPASFWAALVAFAPLCIPVHFVKSRRSWSGLGLGILWMLGVVLAASLTSAGMELLVGRGP
jgi:hypothetical protein